MVRLTILEYPSIKVKTAMRIGMDFGTTNSGIAVYDGTRVRILKLDPVADSSVMRSVIYLTRDHELHVGQAAIDLYHAQNINRERRMVRKRVGRVEMTFADIGKIATDVHVFVDELEPGRLMRSLKSALATPYTGTAIYGKDYTLEALIALGIDNICTNDPALAHRLRVASGETR